jgi:hypothetical protein
LRQLTANSVNETQLSWTADRDSTIVGFLPVGQVVLSLSPSDINSVAGADFSDDSVTERIYLNHDFTWTQLNFPVLKGETIFLSSGAAGWFCFILLEDSAGISAEP